MHCDYKIVSGDVPDNVQLNESWHILWHSFTTTIQLPSSSHEHPCRYYRYKIDTWEMTHTKRHQHFITFKWGVRKIYNAKWKCAISFQQGFLKDWKTFFLSRFKSFFFSFQAIKVFNDTFLLPFLLCFPFELSMNVEDWMPVLFFYNFLWVL